MHESEEKRENFQETLRSIATYHSFSSVRELLQSISRGETATVLLPTEQRVTAVRWLKVIGALHEDVTIRDSFISLAMQLERSARRETIND